MLGTWLSQLDRLRYVRALYFAGVYGRGFAEQKFLFLTQAVEAFHRRYYSGRYIEDQGRFEKTVYEPLVAKIPKTAPSGLGDAIRARLKYGNEYSLRRRIGELVREHSQALKVLERRPESWVSEIVDLRNTLTHYPEMDHVPEHRVDAAIRYSWVLRLLLEVCFMKTMGFGAEEVRDFVQGCRMYRQVAEMVGDGGSREGESAADG